MRFLAVFATFLAVLPARADWLQLRGTHTELVTDAGEKDGRRALTRLEQIRAILPGGSDQSGRELRVVLFDSDLGDSWEFADDPSYDEKYSALGIRIGLNYIMYSITH